MEIQTVQGHAKKDAISDGRGAIERRRVETLVTFIAFCLFLGALGALFLAVDAHGLPSAIRYGDRASEEQVLPTPLLEVDAASVDLDNDGIDEMILLAADGALQRYDNGTLTWSTDAQSFYPGLGAAAEGAPQFITATSADRSYLRSDHGYSFIDIDQDGRLDLAATIYMLLDTPTARVTSAVVYIDGDDGTMLGGKLLNGIARHLVAADLDADGTPEIIVAEEDGRIEPLVHGPRGSGGRTHVWAERLDGTRVWDWTSGRDWGRVEGMGVGTFDGSGPDIVFTLTAALNDMTRLDSLTSPGAQDLVALDGTTGAVAWQTPILDYARGLTIRDINGDTIDDVLLRIAESAAVTESRGDDRSHVEARSGIDGSVLWSLQGLLGATPHVHTIGILDGAALPTVALGYTTGGTGSEGEDALVRYVAAANGTLLADIPIVRSLGGPASVVEATTDVRVPSPESTVRSTAFEWLHMALTDIDDDGDDDTLLGTRRGIVALTTGPDGIVPAWEDRVSTAPQLFLVRDGPAGKELRTQGWIEHTRTDLGAVKITGDERYKLQRLYGWHAATGAPLPDIPFIGQTMAVHRVDLDSDGDLDRVLGGVSGVVFALENPGDRVLWQTDFDNFILDIWSDDLDGDGRTDFLIESHLEVGALSHNGTELWRYKVDARINEGEIRDAESADIDGDGALDLVLARRSGDQGATNPAETARVVAVSGATGQEIWNHVLPPPVTAANCIDTGDLNGDGTPDVAVVLGINTALLYAVEAIDGATGLPLWHFETTTTNGQAPAIFRCAETIDADGDGDLDVAVITEGNPLTIRTHDGATGAPIERRTFASDWNIPRPVLLAEGPFGPGGTAALVTASRESIGAIPVTRIETWTPDLQRLWAMDLPLQSTIFDIKTADVDGDGTGDVVVGATSGLLVIDGARSLSGVATTFGHMTTWHGTKLAVADIDGDGYDEIEFFSDPQNWPLYIGHTRMTDPVRGRAVGVADLDFGEDGPVIPPSNKAPVARIVFDRTLPIHPGDTITLRSGSFDPDGNITSERWILPDGSDATGDNVSFVAGAISTYSARLLVADDYGVVGSAVQFLSVMSPNDHAVKQSRSGSWVSPNETITYSVTVRNIGRDIDTYSVRLAHPDGWTGSLSTSTLTIAPQTEAGIVVTATASTALPVGDLKVVVEGAASGQARIVTHRVVVPLIIDAELLDGPTYGPADDIRGSIRLHWLDGTPLGVTLVRMQVIGPDGDDSVFLTGDDGTGNFAVEKGLAVAHQPGSYSVRLSPDVPGYSTIRTLHYSVGLAG